MLATGISDFTLLRLRRAAPAGVSYLRAHGFPYQFDIDVTGTFPSGKSFATPAEMRGLLREELPEFARCLTEKMLTYALGRGLERYDRKTVDEINRKLSAAGYPFQTMVYEIARSLPFQSRRGEVSKNETKPVPKETAQK